MRTFFGTSEQNDTRLVWVPFHFIPGNEGETFHERMLCRKDSAVVNALLDYYLDKATIEAHRDHMLHLFGIAAHVYADTFSHYGFSGISDEINVVDPDSIHLDESHSPSIVEHIRQQADRFKATFASAARLGHGSVLTHPDRPYLRWQFKYTNGQVSKRNNPATFLEACEALHRRFSQFGAAYYGGHARPPIEWKTIQDAVKQVIEAEGPAEERATFWTKAMRNGLLGGVECCLPYDSTFWMDQTKALEEKGTVEDFLNSHPYRFLAAADYHRNYVLKRLLPRFRLMVA